MKAVSIKPINVPKKGIGTKLMVGVEGYKLLNTDITCYYKILTETDKTVMSGKNINIPIEVYNEWGFDDMVLVNYVSQTVLVDIVEVIDINLDKKKDKKSRIEKITADIQKAIKKQQELIIEKNLAKK